MALVSADRLTKVYGGKVRAVDNVSFEADEGDLVALLGPNGAGKTTTVRMLTTLTKPTSGTAVIDGFDVIRDSPKVRELIGIVPQDLSVDDDLTGMENLILQARLYHIPRDEARERADELVRLVSLTDAAHRDVETYSGGMRKRLEIACGLISRPKVLFLDEPTLGLDVKSRISIWEYLRRLNYEERLTLFITTHYMEEADSLCNKVIIMDRGKVVAQGSPASLKAELGENVFELTIESQSGEVPPAVRRVAEVLSAEQLDKRVFRVKVRCSETSLQEAIKALEAEGVKIKNLISMKPTLAEVFLHHTGEDLEEKQEEAEGEFVEKYLRNARQARK